MEVGDGIGVRVGVRVAVGGIGVCVCEGVAVAEGAGVELGSAGLRQAVRKSASNVQVAINFGMG